MKKEKPKILFYCQHSLGMGHLVRSLALADALAKDFEITLLNGGLFPKKIRVPEAVEIMNLPPLGFDKNHQLISCDKRRSVERAKVLRKEIILETFRKLKPEIVLIELFPFGRKKFADELLPLLETAKGGAKIVCSLRDILVGNRKEQEKFEEKAIETANRFFDAVLIHSDENFARFEDSLKTKAALQIPKFYTGFIVPNAERQNRQKSISKSKKIIVSAGGGMVGERLLQTAVAAHKILSKTQKIETEIIAGLFLPKEIFRELKNETRGVKGLKITRFVQNLRAEMAAADVSVSQCGYNTAFDILLSGVSALVVPYSEKGEDEQSIRAQTLEKTGALRVLKTEELNALNLASEIKTSFDFQPAKNLPDINGGNNSAKILKALPAENRAGTEAEKSWLAPVSKILSERSEEIRIFFRDDDAGIADERLFALLDIFEKYKIPLDLAVIPEFVRPDFAEELAARIRASNNLFSIHQHGFSHTNHETAGRKCEFGAARLKTEQFRDISEGKKILKSFFGSLPQPVFTPPWNRCTNETAEVLRELNFQILSRETKAKSLQINGLTEIPVSIDWFAKRKGVYLGKAEIGVKIAEKIASSQPFGIMLHHAEMDSEEREIFEELCRIFTEFRQVKLVSMLDLFAGDRKTFWRARHDFFTERSS